MSGRLQLAQHFRVRVRTESERRTMSVFGGIADNQRLLDCLQILREAHVFLANYMMDWQ